MRQVEDGIGAYLVSDDDHVDIQGASAVSLEPYAAERLLDGLRALLKLGFVTFA